MSALTKPKTVPASSLYSLLAVAACFVWFAAASPLYLNVSDDGSYALDAACILRGQVPYRDFTLVSTPAHSYVLALLYRIFGRDLMVERLWNAFILALCPLILYRTTRRAFGAPWARLGAFLAVVWIGRLSHISGALPSALAAVLGSFAFLMAAETDRSRRNLTAAGALAALGTLFRQDIGVYASLATVFFFYLRRREIYEPASRDLTFYALGAAAVLAPPLVYFAAAAGRRELFYDLVYYPLFVYPDYSKLYYPSLSEGLRSFLNGRSYFWNYLGLFGSRFAFYLVPVAVAAAWIGLLARWRKALYPAQGNALILFTLAAFFSLNQLFRRPDAYHMTAAFLFALTPALYLAARALRGQSGPDRTNLIIVLVLLGGLFTAPTLVSRFHELSALRKDTFRVGVKGALHIRPLPSGMKEAQLWNNYEYAVNFIKHYTGPNQPIFVGSIRHDRFCQGDPLFYFLADRPPATRFYRMQRGVVTHPDVQRQIMRELDARRVQLIVLRKDLDDCCTEPNLSSRARGVTALDDYLKTHYAVKTKFGGNWILERVW